MAEITDTLAMPSGCAASLQPQSMADVSVPVWKEVAFEEQPDRSQYLGSEGKRDGRTDSKSTRASTESARGSLGELLRQEVGKVATTVDEHLVRQDAMLKAILQQLSCRPEPALHSAVFALEFLAEPQGISDRQPAALHPLRQEQQLQEQQLQQQDVGVSSPRARSEKRTFTS
ncbi:unnamed protein product, partial [Polarella glacialis]